MGLAVKYKIKALIVVGARPNFMKAAPIIRAIKASGVLQSDSRSDKIKKQFFQ